MVRHSSMDSKTRLVNHTEFQINRISLVANKLEELKEQQMKIQELQ